MKITLRQESIADYKIVEDLIEETFLLMKESDQSEHFLVNRLRRSDAFIPELSIVAEYEHTIVGHIILTKIKIKNEEQSFDSLALAPVSVKPIFQNKGIGGQLIKEAHLIARNLGFQSVILLGHADYYPRFGYSKIIDFGIKLPFKAPEENCMAIELIENALDQVSGEVEYSKAFFE